MDDYALQRAIEAATRAMRQVDPSSYRRAVEALNQSLASLPLEKIGRDFERMVATLGPSVQKAGQVIADSMGSVRLTENIATSLAQVRPKLDLLLTTQTFNNNLMVMGRDWIELAVPTPSQRMVELVDMAPGSRDGLPTTDEVLKDEAASIMRAVHLAVWVVCILLSLTTQVHGYEYWWTFGIIGLGLEIWDRLHRDFPGLFEEEER